MLIADTRTNTHYVVTDAEGAQHLACTPTKDLPKKVTIAEARTFENGFTQKAVCHRCNGVNWRR